MDVNILKNLAEKYFELFSDKNSREVAGMLSEDVTLTDWDISCSGKIEVMNVVKRIFDSVDTIDVKPTNIYCDKNIVIAELNIVVNETESLSVVDVIEYNQNNKIVSIRAYKC